jgi:3',5'-cyclic AMP phosphodiesterase CpdA
MTDIHMQPEKQATEGYKAAIAKVNALKPAFVITGGDLIMDAFEQTYGRADSLYNLFILTNTLFEMPVYHTIGNHDIYGLHEKSHAQPDHPEYGKMMFRKRLGGGKRYRSFDHGKWHFILLDSIEPVEGDGYIGKIDTEQLEWLLNDLNTVGKERPIVISVHIPFFSVSTQFRNGSTVANSEGLIITNAKEVWDRIAPYKVKLVLQGHLHIVEEIVWKETRFVTGGAVCGAWWNGPYVGFPEGMIVVDVKGDDLTWRYETYGWQTDSTE